MLILFLFVYRATGQEVVDWVAAEGYEPIPEHVLILDSARRYTAARDKTLEREFSYNYEYRIEKNGMDYHVFVLIQALDDEGNPSYFPGGHFGLYIDSDGEVIDLHPGQ